VRIEASNCTSQVDVLLTGGFCGRSHIDYSMDTEQCAHAKLLCSPLRGVEGESDLITTIWSSDGFPVQSEDGVSDGRRSILELVKEERIGGAASELNLVCNENSQWEVVGGAEDQAIPNPVTLYCLSGVARNTETGNRARKGGLITSRRESASVIESSNSLADSFSGETGVAPASKPIASSVNGPVPTFSISKRPLTQTHSTAGETAVNPGTIRNVSNALLPLLQLLGR